MNRYPVWKYLVIVVTLLLGALYTAPNYFGESPAVQVTSGKTSVKLSEAMVAKVDEVLKREHIASTGIAFDGEFASVRARFSDPDTQFRAKAALEKGLNADPSDPAYLVALNLLADTPQWMQTLRALPMYKGLDLRGGVHFLMQVDTRAALDKRLQSTQASVRTLLRDKDVRHAGIERVSDGINITFRDEAMRERAKNVLSGQISDLAYADAGLTTTITLKPGALKQAVEEGVKQNISTLSKRVNELGVAEPIIQQQGPDRIVVQLPGVQDVARARAVIGRTATLEVHMVDESVMRGTELSATVPLNSQLYTAGRDAPAVLYKEVVLTGDYITNATAGLDDNQQPAVFVDLNSEGGRKLREATRDRVGKHMAIVLVEKGKPEVISVATLTSELGSHFRTTGVGGAEKASELALLLRSGALSAPRHAHHAARRAARASASDRHQEGLRPRPVRRLHRDRRRPPHQFLPDAGRDARRRRASPRSRAGHAGQAASDAGRLREARRLSSAATARPARSARPSRCWTRSRPAFPATSAPT
jgi:preprotein translocase subunit SecD